MNEQKFPVVTHQLLSDHGINPFAVQLLGESIMRHPKPVPVSFSLLINRPDMPEWSALKVYLEPVPKAAELEAK